MKNPKITRRQMLAGSAQAIATLTLASSCSLEQSRSAKAKPAGFKIGACDWTLRKRTDPTSLELAKRLGLDGIQVDFGSGEEDLPLFDPQLQAKFLAEAQKHNVEVASLAMGTLNNVPYQSDPRAERWVEQSIGVCKAMGVTVVLLPFFSKADLRNDKAANDAVIKKLRKVAPKAEKAGIILGIESQLNAEQHMYIVDGVGSPAVQVYYDVGNSNKAGYDIYKEIRFLGKNICEFHAKDYKDLYGKGNIDFPEVRRAMDDIGYRGWIVVEGTKFPLGREESCRYDAEYLRTVFPRKV